MVELRWCLWRIPVAFAALVDSGAPEEEGRGEPWPWKLDIPLVFMADKLEGWIQETIDPIDAEKAAKRKMIKLQGKILLFFVK
jgi:hypothetical protein